jgi:fibronectin type 3 domain-containing protein
MPRRGSTQRELKSLVTLVLLSLLGCGTIGAPQPPSANIPQAVTDLRTARKGDTITLSWTPPEQTTDGALVHKPGKMIVRRTITENPTPTVVGELPVPPARKSENAQPVSIKDSLTPLITAASGDFATYTVEVWNNSGKGAGPSNAVAVPLVPVPAPPKDVQLGVVAAGVSITWNQTWPPQNKTGLAVQYAYRIMRRQEGSNQSPVLVQQLNATNSAAMVIDRTIEWEKHYEYWVTPVTLWRNGDQQNGEVEGDDSLHVSVFTHDVFPPAVPSGLQAIFSQVGQQSFIDLTWIPNSDSDLAGYNVYRRTENSQPVKINNELIKTPAFRDTNVQPGMKYFYSVSAVDLRNNESGRSPEASESVPQQ